MLTLQFVPYDEIEHLDSSSRISKLLGLVKDNKIVLMQGRLRVTEETKLIESTMNEINGNFKGIEVCTIYPERKRGESFGIKMKKEVAKILLGNREGLTIIGPSTLIKEIKRDPNKIQLLATELSLSRKRRSSERKK